LVKGFLGKIFSKTVSFIALNRIVYMSIARSAAIGLLVLVCFMQMGFSTRKKFHFAASSYYIVIDKSENTLTVYDPQDWVVQFPCTFGSRDLGDKMVQGDRRTPEGRFHIISKAVHNKWDRFMKLDYPTAADYAKFNQRKAAGIIPKNAKIGGDIGIHGTWPHEEWAVENLQAWTQGCISMKNEDVEELYRLIGQGTLVIIQR
jgi:murein L,D-transpeptidase YafK